MKPYQLDKNYRITAERWCFVLEQLRGHGKEGMRWEQIAWYQSLSELLRGYTRLCVRKKRTGAVRAIEDAVRHAESHLAPLAGKLGGVL